MPVILGFVLLRDNVLLMTDSLAAGAIPLNGMSFPEWVTGALSVARGPQGMADIWQQGSAFILLGLTSNFIYLVFWVFLITPQGGPVCTGPYHSWRIEGGKSK